MRKTQMALAAVALVASTAAMANGVTVSGVIDAGIQNTTSKGAHLNYGLLAPNFVNVSGKEDLGGGMSAQFFLQHRLDLGAGTKVSDFWNQSYVGLTTGAGTLQVGKNVDAMFGVAAGFDVTGGGNMGSLVDPILATGVSAIFANNMVKYISPDIGGLNVQASLYPMADSTVTGNTKNDYSVAGTYNLGGLNVGAASVNRTGPTTGASRVSGTGTFIGAGYDFGIAKVNVTYIDTKNAGNSVGVNAAIPVPGVEALTATAGYYDMSSATKNSGSLYSVGLKYALSKRTTVFGNFQDTSGAAVTNMGTSFGGTAYQVAGGAATTLGISHSF